MGIKTDKSLTTKGSTSPRRTLYPEVLLLWEDFSQTQADIFRALHNIFHTLARPAPRPFNSILNIKSLGQDHYHVRLANESSLRTYEHIALETPASKILSHLNHIPGAEEELGVKLGQGIAFESTPHSLSDREPEV